MALPTFGMTINNVEEDVFPASTADMSVCGLVGAAPAADATKFPLNTPVFLNSGDTAVRTLLGATGVLPQAIADIEAQTSVHGISARCVVVRTEPTAEATLGASAAGTGIFALLKSGPELGVIPRLIAVPGMTATHTTGAANPIVAALPSVLGKLHGVAVCDAPRDDWVGYQDWRETTQSERIIPLATGVKHASVVYDGAPSILGLAVARDYNHLGIPSHSWANQPIYGIDAPSRFIDYSLIDGATEGQELLSTNAGIIVRGQLGVDTAIANGGFVYIGTDTCAENTLWTFYNEVRTRDYIHLALLRTLRYYLGRYNLTAHTVQCILNTMDGFMAQMKAQQAILGYKISFPKGLNSTAELRLGHLKIYFQAEPPAPLTRIDIQSARYLPAVDALLQDIVDLTA